MKKLLFITCILLLTFGNNGVAQHAYLRAGAGYALPQGGYIQGPIPFNSATIGLPTNGSLQIKYANSVATQTYDYKKTSYGAGVQGTLAFGYMLNRNVGIELAGNFGLQNTEYNTVVNTQSEDEQVSLNVYQRANMPILVIPSIVLQAGGKWKLYARAGVVLPVRTKLIQEGAYTRDKFNPATNAWVRLNNIKYEEEFSMRLNPGLAGAMGLRVNAGKLVSFWAEANLISLTMYAKESVLTSAIVDDVQIIDYISQGDKTTKYEMKGTISGYSNTVQSFQVPFSTLGIQAGISLRLGKPESAKTVK